MKKVLFITTRLFWPTDSGRKVSLYHYCKGLSEYCGYEVHIYSFTESGQSEKDLENHPDFITSVTLASHIKKTNKIKNLIGKSLFQGFPLQCSLYYSKSNVKRIRELCDKLNPDVIIVDMVRLAPYIKAFSDRSCVKILDMDDLLSLRYERQANSVNCGSNITGNYEIGSAGGKLLGNSRIKRMILRSESKRMRKAEIRYANLYDKTIFVSDRETDELNKICGFEKAYTVRLGVDYDYYSAQPNACKEKGSLAFLGNMKVAANADSLIYIIKNILPKLDFEYKLHVVGAVTDDFAEKYGRNNIIFHGRVDDVREVIGGCEIFLSPIVYGTGIKTKILEAMAMGIPVITNSVGAEGIDGLNNVHFVVRDSADELAASVNEMTGREMTSMINAARELIRNKYTWNNIYADLKKVVDGDGDENNMADE